VLVGSVSQPNTASRISRRKTALQVVVAAAALSLGVAACSSGISHVESHASSGWPSYGGTDGNANFSTATVPDNLALNWSRPTGGPISAQPVISGKDAIGITADTENGCNTFYFDAAAGRKLYCKRLQGGAQLSSLLLDQYDNAYIGVPGTFFGLNTTGAVRWQTPTVGLALSAKFAGPATVLAVTQQGQVQLINAQTGRLQAAPVTLRTDTDASNPGNGLGDCVDNGPRCPVPAAPAVDVKRQQFYLNFWPQGKIASQVRAFDYSEVKGTKTIRDAWTADIPGGVIGSPVLSPDSSALYIYNRLGSLYALDAASGKQLWNYNVGGYGMGTMAVSPNGTIVPTGVLGAPLVAIKNDGGKPTALWHRDDLHTASTATLLSNGTGWVAVRDAGKDTLSLVEFDAANGATKRTLPLPDSLGYVTGIAVSSGGELVATTQIGNVYQFSARSGS